MTIKEITATAVAQVQFAKLGIAVGKLTTVADGSLLDYVDYVTSHFKRISSNFPNNNTDDLLIGLIAAYSIRRWTQEKVIYEFDQGFLQQLLHTKNFKFHQELLYGLPTTNFVMPLPESMTYYAMYVHVEFHGKNTVFAVCPFNDNDAAQYAVICENGKMLDPETAQTKWSKFESSDTAKKQACDILKIAVSACYYLVATNSTLQVVEIPKSQRIAIKRNGKTHKFITRNYRVYYGNGFNIEKPLRWQHFRTGQNREMLEVRLLNA